MLWDCGWFLDRSFQAQVSWSFILRSEFGPFSIYRMGDVLALLHLKRESERGLLAKKQFWEIIHITNSKALRFLLLLSLQEYTKNKQKVCSISKSELCNLLSFIKSCFSHTLQEEKKIVCRKHWLIFPLHVNSYSERNSRSRSHSIPTSDI